MLSTRLICITKTQTRAGYQRELHHPPNLQIFSFISRKIISFLELLEKMQIFAAEVFPTEKQFRKKLNYRNELPNKPEVSSSTGCEMSSLSWLVFVLQFGDCLPQLWASIWLISWRDGVQVVRSFGGQFFPLFPTCSRHSRPDQIWNEIASWRWWQICSQICEQICINLRPPSASGTR